MSVENKAKRVAESKSVMTEMVMPNDANPWVISWAGIY